MSVWHVTNHKLYSGTNDTDVSNPKFLVGTEFGFGNPPLADWTNEIPKTNRALAGNTVLMWGEYFSTNSAINAADRFLSCLYQNSNIDYFIPNIDLFNDKVPSLPTLWAPRGEHSYVQNQSDYVNNGHWVKTPNSNDGNNSPATDQYYISSYGDLGDTSHWYSNSNYYGTEQYHSAWLNRLKTHDASVYNKIAAWYLMDEPFNTNLYRDAQSNQYSVSGHSAFCSGVEGNDKRPKMVGPGGHSNANDQYTAISGAIGIMAGNYYGDVASDTTLWWTPNMVAWMYSKISNETRKMVIPWLWGRYSDLTWSKYVFYGSLIEGARGVIWWMKSNDQPQTPDYSSYAHQRTAYGLFTNTASFNNNPSFPPDRNIFLSGTELPVANYSPNHGFSYDAGNYYPKTISKATSIKAFSYIHNGSTRWRIYAVNHSNANVDLTAEISGIAPSLTAYKRDSQDYILTTNLPNGSNRMVDTLGANACQFYDVGN